jgi:hypothetical protein
MNEWDRDNLHFIMTCSEEEFRAWFDQASDDDITYALELIAQSRAEVVEQQFDVYNRESERIMLKHGKYPEASAILSKFMLNKA